MDTEEQVRILGVLRGILLARVVCIARVQASTTPGTSDLPTPF
jgi:hypothetical protein